MLDILVHGLHAHQEYRDVHQLPTGHAAASAAAVLGGYQAQRSLEEVYNLRMRGNEEEEESSTNKKHPTPNTYIITANKVVYRSPYSRAEQHRRGS